MSAKGREEVEASVLLAAHGCSPFPRVTPHPPCACRLPQERLNMLQLAGVDMDHFPPHEWLQHAHTAVRFVSGTNPADLPPPPWPAATDPKV